MLLTIAAFFFVLSIVVFVHEFGHFIVAKLNGIYVVTFSFGFGPKLLRKRIGETEYAISSFPFGGYVKFAGESAEEDSGDGQETSQEVKVPEDRLYRNKSPLQRMAVVVAGPFMNALLALLVFIFGVYIQGIKSINPDVIIHRVAVGSPAWDAGLKAGDRILEINGKVPRDYYDVGELIVYEYGVPSQLLILRDADTLKVDVSPAYDPEADGPRVGIVASTTPKIGDVKLESPAYNAGIRKGAVILSIDDEPVITFEDLEEKIRPKVGVPLKITWELEGVKKSSMITPVPTEVPEEGEGKLTVKKVGAIGVGVYWVEENIKLSFPNSVRRGAESFYYMLISILSFLGKLVTGKVSVRAVGGPLRVGVMAGEMVRWGFDRLIYFLAFFSMNLSIFNLLPLVPFDGGHFVLYLLELVSGRKISERVQHAIMQVGFVILIVLMVFILALDIFNIFS